MVADLAPEDLAPEDRESDALVLVDFAPLAFEPVVLERFVLELRAFEPLVFERPDVRALEERVELADFPLRTATFPFSVRVRWATDSEGIAATARIAMSSESARILSCVKVFFIMIYLRFSYLLGLETDPTQIIDKTVPFRDSPQGKPQTHHCTPDMHQKASFRPKHCLLS